MSKVTEHSKLDDMSHGIDGLKIFITYDTDLNQKRKRLNKKRSHISTYYGSVKFSLPDFTSPEEERDVND